MFGHRASFFNTHHTCLSAAAFSDVCCLEYIFLRVFYHTFGLMFLVLNIRFRSDGKWFWRLPVASPNRLYNELQFRDWYSGFKAASLSVAFFSCCSQWIYPLRAAWKKGDWKWCSLETRVPMSKLEFLIEAICGAVWAVLLDNYAQNLASKWAVWAVFERFI